MIEKRIAGEVEMQERIELYKIIIDALEKKIPFQPHRFLYYDGQCKCGTVFMDRTAKFCPNCGQKLKWDE